MTVRVIAFASLLLAVTVGLQAQERSFRFVDADLKGSLDSLLQWYGVPLIYLDKDVSGKRVNASCDACTFTEALRKVIEGQQLEARTIGLQVVLRDRPAPPDVSSTFAGTVQDAQSGEPLIGAEVLLRRRTEGTPPAPVHRWGSANQFGFFSLRNVEPGSYLLTVRRLGYADRSENLEILPASEVIRDLDLTGQGFEHPEIVVEGRRSEFTSMEGVSGGIYVRATPTDHNQYLLEGARIYNPVHFGGLLSTFNGDAVKDLQMVAGGVPPYYGGRIGGILDVALRDGSDRSFRGSATTGSLTSGLIMEGPLFPGITFLLSGRAGYPDVFAPAIDPDRRRSDHRSAEVLSKLTYHISPHQRLALSGYVGSDGYRNTVPGTVTSPLSNKLTWGNATANMRWSGIVSPALFFNVSAIYSRYGFDADHSYGPGASSTLGRFTSDAFIEDLSLRAHAEYYYDEQHTLLLGTELVRHRLGGMISEFSNQIGPMSFGGVTPWELAVYVQDQWRLTPSVLAQVGARATSFVSDQGSFSAVDPRVSLLLPVRHDLRLFTSLSAVTQFVHPYRNSGIFLYYPSIFMYASSDRLQPTTSMQFSFGAERTLGDETYRIALESYYRLSKGLHEFVYDSLSSTPLPDHALKGEGVVYGIEFTFDKRLGAFTGTARYGLSWANNRFAELNGGEPFRPRFDRRHELYLTAAYVPSDAWAFEVTCLLSGSQITTLSSDAAAASAPRESRDLTATFAGAQYSEPYDIDGGRLPGFQRLEFRITHRLMPSPLPIHLSLRLVNGYGMVDPFVWEQRQSIDPRLRWRVRLDAPPLFPLYPVVSIGTRF